VRNIANFILNVLIALSVFGKNVVNSEFTNLNKLCYTRKYVSIHCNTWTHVIEHEHL